MTYAVWIDQTFLWVVRRDREAFLKLDIGRQEFEDANGSASRGETPGLLHV